MFRGSSLIWVNIFCNISYIRATLEHQQTREADDKWLNTVSFEEKNYITEILIYVCFVKQMCKQVAAQLPPLLI